MVRRRPSTNQLKKLTIAELQALLDKKISQERKKLPRLQNKRDNLASQLEEIDAEIAAIEGSASSGRGAAKRRGRKPGRRGRKAVAGSIRAERAGKMTIPAAIHQVLQDAGKPMRAVDIRNEILNRKLIKGTKKSFPAQVNIALGKHKEFKKKGRGLYSL
jgi:hypothetical protein